VAAVVSTQEC